MGTSVNQWTASEGWEIQASFQAKSARRNVPRGGLGPVQVLPCLDHLILITVVLELLTTRGLYAFYFSFSSDRHIIWSRAATH